MKPVFKILLARLLVLSLSGCIHTSSLSVAPTSSATGPATSSTGEFVVPVSRVAN